MRLFYAILLHLSAGLWTSAFLLDVLYFQASSTAAAHRFALSSSFCMAAGILAACVSIGFGLSEYYRTPHPAIARHLLVSLGVMLIFIFNLFSRIGLAEGALDRALPVFISRGQMVSSALGLLGLVLSEFFNRELVRSGLTSSRRDPKPTFAPMKNYKQARAG